MTKIFTWFGEVIYEADNTQTTYYYGADGLAAQYNSGTKKYFAYHYDNIGSTTLITAKDGHAVERFSYGTYGELLKAAITKIRFLYNGSYGVTTDSNGLYYMRARYYNPDIKRFINQDIKVGDIGSSQSLNRYAYCEGNPVSMVDPFGLCPESTQDQGQKSKYDWLHTVLDVAGLFFDAADVINAGLYAMEGDWVNAAVCIASALPVIGTAVAGVTKGTKIVKAGKAIEKTLKLAGKTYATVQTATAALEMAGDAKIQYAASGGKMTLNVAAKIVGATAMTAISVAAAGSLMKDLTSLSKVSNISLNTSSQKSADLESGRCAKGEGIGCFVAGTKVKTVNGEKNIEDVESGDYVLAENPETGEQEYKKVVRTYIHEKTTLVHVFVGKEEIETTVEHPFYVEGIGFVSAGELRAGDIIRTSEGKNLPVDKVELEPLEEPVLVYNFEVENFHTYYVSGLGVLVHNDCSGESGGKTNWEAHNVVNYAKLKEQYRVSELANDVVDSITQTGTLPSNYITKSQARAMGWSEGKALNNYAPGKAIGGDVFANTNSVLPSANGRVWYEADVGIDYTMSRSNAKNPAYRILYSNDGLIYGTYDHYNTVFQIFP
ncbi:MAG: hypothetical protein K2L07_04310 [Lachnospiraceae bacterium]|nr:hypothetical protein [Lachnospiraceae bacterium]